MDSFIFAVKIYMTHCPWNTAMSPWWYQLEVVNGTDTETAAPMHGQADAINAGKIETGLGSISDEGPDYAPKITSGKGKFWAMSRNHEIQLCDNFSVSFCATSKITRRAITSGRWARNRGSLTGCFW